MVTHSLQFLFDLAHFRSCYRSFYDGITCIVFIKSTRIKHKLITIRFSVSAIISSGMFKERSLAFFGIRVKLIEEFLEIILLK